MSQMKIKNPLAKKKKTGKGPGISPRQALKNALGLKLFNKRASDDEVVASLMDSGDFDVKRYLEYDYIKEVAKELEWTHSRLQKSIDRTINFKKLMESAKNRTTKNAIEKAIKEKKDEPKENRDEDNQEDSKES